MPKQETVSPSPAGEEKQSAAGAAAAAAEAGSQAASSLVPPSPVLPPAFHPGGGGSFTAGMARKKGKGEPDPSPSEIAGEYKVGVVFGIMNRARPPAQPTLFSPWTKQNNQGFLLDMDGVLHQCGAPVRGASAFLHMLRVTNTPFMLLTNECRYTNETLSERLLKILGIAPKTTESA